MKNSFFNLIIRTLHILFLILFVQQIGVAQSSSAQVVTSRFEKHRRSYLEEKQYVHTDKDFYLAGETVWFKIYTVDASLHHPLGISKAAYLEVLDATHKPVLQTKISLAEGIGVGSVTLPDDLSSGNYLIRSYTNWMKNFDADFYFEKNISVVNTVRDVPVKQAKGDSVAIGIQFFPEGGNLVNGVKSKVAFRAVDQWGRGVDITGVIINGNNDTLTHFSSVKFGIGSFELVPVAQTDYKALVRFNNRSLAKDLPEVNAQGYVLSLIERGTEVEVNVLASEAFETATVHLFAHTRGVIAESNSATLQNKGAKFLIDKRKLGDGISQITLFNNQMQPVCERLYFKQPEHKLEITAKAEKQAFNSREKISIDVAVADETGREKSADLSVAVYQIDSSAAYGSDILSYLLLSSDLRGTIESPSYYVQNTDSARQAVDHLMLTHGWRRFKWQQVFEEGDTAYQFLPEIEGLIVSAKITNTQTEQPVLDARAFLSIPARTFHLYGDLSNGKGDVHFYTKGFYGRSELVAQTDTDQNYRIDIKTPFSEKTSSRSVAALDETRIGLDRMQRKSVNMQVENIYTADKQVMIKPLVDTALFYGKPHISYQLDDYVRFPTMEEVLREYVREINVYRQGKGYSIALMKKHPTGLVDKKSPLVLLDGVPVFDVNKLMVYDPLKIKELQTINQDYYLGKLGFEGVVSFRTYTGRPEGLQTESKATIIDYEGLQVQREFYSPVYDTEQSRSSRLPDFRNLLYWQPQLKAEGKNNTVSFYSSDMSGQYLVVIQGLSKDGRAGSKAFTFTVVNPLFADAK